MAYGAYIHNILLPHFNRQLVQCKTVLAHLFLIYFAFADYEAGFSAYKYPELYVFHCGEGYENFHAKKCQNPAALLQSGGAIAEKLTELGFSTTMSSTYVQIAQTEFISKNFEAFRGLSDKLVQIDFSFLGLNLGDEPSYKFWTFFETSDFWPMLGLFLIPLLTALATYLQSYITMKKSGTAGRGREKRNGIYHNGELYRLP